MERIVQYDTGNTFFRGLIPTVPTPQGWMLEQPVILNKPFPSFEQQFQTFEPRGTIVTFTPQGWMQQQPNNEIFIPQFNVSQQQFSILNPVFPDVQGVTFFKEADDSISASETMSAATVPTTTRINGVTYDSRGAPLLWFIDTATGLGPIDSDGNPINPF